MISGPDGNYIMIAGIDYPALGVCFQCYSVFSDGRVHYLFSLRSQNCRDEQGRWDPGGGKVDLGRSIRQTLEAEIKEEYCAEILRADFLGIRDVFRQVDKDGEQFPCHWTMIDFKCQVLKGAVKIGEPHKCDALGWFDNLDPPGMLMHSQWPEFVRRYRSKLLDFNYRNSTCLEA